jgi:hypothetical protein
VAGMLVLGRRVLRRGRRCVVGMMLSVVMRPVPRMVVQRSLTVGFGRLREGGLQHVGMVDGNDEDESDHRRKGGHHNQPFRPLSHASLPPFVRARKWHNARPVVTRHSSVNRAAPCNIPNRSMQHHPTKRHSSCRTGRRSPRRARDDASNNSPRPFRRAAPCGNISRYHFSAMPT